MVNKQVTDNLIRSLGSIIAFAWHGVMVTALARTRTRVLRPKPRNNKASHRNSPSRSLQAESCAGVLRQGVCRSRGANLKRESPSAGFHALLRGNCRRNALAMCNHSGVKFNVKLSTIHLVILRQNKNLSISRLMIKKTHPSFQLQRQNGYHQIINF